MWMCGCGYGCVCVNVDMNGNGCGGEEVVTGVVWFIFISQKLLGDGNRTISELLWLGTSFPYMDMDA